MLNLKAQALLSKKSRRRRASHQRLFKNLSQKLVSSSSPNRVFRNANLRNTKLRRRHSKSSLRSKFKVKKLMLKARRRRMRKMTSLRDFLILLRTLLLLRKLETIEVVVGTEVTMEVVVIVVMIEEDLEVTMKVVIVVIMKVDTGETTNGDLEVDIAVTMMVAIVITMRVAIVATMRAIVVIMKEAIVIIMMVAIAITMRVVTEVTTKEAIVAAIMVIVVIMREATKEIIEVVKGK